MDQNKNTYSSSDVINYYKDYEGLQKPEQTIFDILKKDLSAMNMLDIGIGAGRTTRVFAPAVKRYVGVDYSTGMVEACEKKFAGSYPSALYKTVDVRDLSDFSKEEFDLVLFSFNGIDYINYEERQKALLQIRRVVKPGGHFCFSTHNLKSMENIPAISFRFNVFAMIKKMVDVKKIKRINSDQLKNLSTSDYLYINDGAHNYSLETCYIRTFAQIAQLRSAGFNAVDVFSLKTGKKLETKEEITAADDKWLYFLCR